MAEERQQDDGGRPREEVVGADDPASPNVRGEEATLAIGGFRLIERALLIFVALMTLGAAAIGSPFVYPIFIAITALVRLIVLLSLVFRRVPIARYLSRPA